MVKKITLEELAEIAEALSIWRPASVSDEPQAALSRWRVYNVMLPGSNEYTMHMVGNTGYEGRVSSPIMTYDVNTKRGVSRSGRIYELVGASGHCRDASYVFNRWLGAMSNPQAIDVTDKYES